MSPDTVRQRVKEIGIRKVLGASVGSIVQLLSSGSILLVLLAVVIASPVAWWGMNTWLNDFAFRTTIEWWMFVVAGLAAVLIALLTGCWKASRAAGANPVGLVGARSEKGRVGEKGVSEWRARWWP